MPVMLLASLAAGGASAGGGLWNMFAASKNAQNQKDILNQQYNQQVQQENFRRQQSFKSIDQNVSNTGTDFASRGITGDYTSSSVANSSVNQENQQHQLVMDQLNSNLENQLNAVSSQETALKVQSGLQIAGALFGSAVSMAGSWLNYGKSTIPNTNQSSLQSSDILNQNLALQNTDTNNFGQLIGATNQSTSSADQGLSFGSGASIGSMGSAQTQQSSIPDYTSLYSGLSGKTSSSRLNGLNNSWLNWNGNNPSNAFGWNF